MTAETSRKNGNVSILPALRLRWPAFLRRRHEHRLALNEQLEPEGLSAHMTRDIGLNDARLTYDSRRSDCEP